MSPEKRWHTNTSKHTNHKGKQKNCVNFQHSPIYINLVVGEKNYSFYLDKSYVLTTQVNQMPFGIHLKAPIKVGTTREGVGYCFVHTYVPFLSPTLLTDNTRPARVGPIDYRRASDSFHLAERETRAVRGDERTCNKENSATSTRIDWLPATTSTPSKDKNTTG